MVSDSKTSELKFMQVISKSIDTKTIWQKLKIDPILLGCTIALFSISFIVVYSSNPSFAIVERLFLRVTFALLIMILIAQIPIRILKNWSTWFYVISLIMLILVLAMGYKTKGAQRWLDLGILRFQPSELMKLAVPIFAAAYLHNCILPPKFKELLVPLTITLVPFILTAIQPDLGTAILIACPGLLVIYFAGMRWKIINLSILSAILSLPIVWMFLHDYQKKRILTLINPELDPFGSGYQIIQSKIAIGSGGLYGKGWLHGTQSHLEFLPERTTDFIFAVFSEEFGFVGIMILLFIYAIIIFRGLQISIKAHDTFSRLLSGSIVVTFFVYVFVNIGMVSGILPVVGVPLPLISYGGTSLLTIMVSFGILMSVQHSKNLVKK